MQQNQIMFYFSSEIMCCVSGYKIKDKHLYILKKKIGGETKGIYD